MSQRLLRCWVQFTERPGHWGVGIDQLADPIRQVPRGCENAIDVEPEVVVAVPRRFDANIFCMVGDDANSRQHLLSDARALHTLQQLRIRPMDAHGWAMLRRRTRRGSTSLRAVSMDFRLVSSFWMR